MNNDHLLNTKRIKKHVEKLKKINYRELTVEELNEMVKKDFLVLPNIPKDILTLEMCIASVEFAINIEMSIGYVENYVRKYIPDNFLPEVLQFIRKQS